MEKQLNDKDNITLYPKNESAEDLRKWLFGIIDSELDKDPQKIDLDLISECIEFEAELPSSVIEISEEDYEAGLRQITSRNPK